MIFTMYDVIVIGAGVGGYNAAIKAAKSGLKTAIIEAADVGGTCLNRGCIPTKYLISEMHKFRGIQERTANGFYNGRISLNYPAMISGMLQKINRLTSGIGWLLNSNGVEMIRGQAEFMDAHKIIVHGEEKILEAKHIIIATGSKPRTLSFECKNLNGENHIYTTDDIWTRMKQIPESLTIVGGGAVGLEFAFIYAGFGTRVILLEGRDSFFKSIDNDIENELIKMLRQNKIEYRLNCTIAEICEINNRVTVFDENEEEIAQTEALLFAMGRTPNYQSLRLENAGVNVTGRGIVIDDEMQTTAEGVYAVGDVNGRLTLAYTASAQAQNVVVHINGKAHEKEMNLVPICVFSDCEIAYVGKLGTGAESNRNSKTAKFLMTANGRSSVDGNGGFIKLFTDEETGVIVGGICVCNMASELINTVAVAIRNKMTTEQFASVIFPHPTYSEALGEAAELIDGHCVHML